ncbi:MAG: TetR/AcrR family transcriptional regulator [Candidatus Enteromonas sp.]|jgi:AcrR family transcriptional regulator|nr:TetR/AcrR family transcriptional regulator [Bacilli bacterium]MEE3299283.1 TetR/AcrR family transcriptional regulator [Candidatus Enteromonas sp.]MBQ2052378.1 TetR/AcrR family transcriptional regulator [Bacilli bacterium]MBQ4182423.1 TetR/AcrR family transcriptional regulator [Bacilli bacterium]MCR5091584.1 TetR/AcrR family transcriptional regulator [Bacilli bacterium]
MPKILDKPREGILGAAEQELAEKGVSGFNIRDVASLSGVAIGTIYNYYGNKFSLINSVLASLWAKSLAKAVAMIKPGDPVGAVLALYEAARGYMDAERETIEAIREAGPYFGDGEFEDDVIQAEIAKSIAPALSDGVIRCAETILAELIVFAAVEHKISGEELRKVVQKIVA